MKKTKKIAGGALLGGLFIAAVLFCVKSYLPKEEEKDTTKNTEAEKESGEQVYNLGEDIEMGNIVWNVKEAELITDYEKIDSYYKSRGYLMSPEEYLSMTGTGETGFPEEVQFLRLSFSVTNNGSAQKNFTPENLRLYSITDNGFSTWYFYTYDGRYILDGEKQEEIYIDGSGFTKASVNKNYFIQPGETILVDYIGEFYLDAKSEMYSYDIDSIVGNSYDLYFMVYSVGTEIIPGSGTEAGKRIRLNIEGSFADKAGAYAKVRDIQGMKCRSWTNLELAQKEQRGYSLEETQKEIVETEEAGQQFTDFVHAHMVTPPEVSSALRFNTLLSGIQIVEWKDMPAVYNEQGNLKQMAQRYQNIHGCKEEDLKILLLDVTYSVDEFGQLLYEEDKSIVSDFYGRSELYVKNDANELWLFGLADDWTVLSNSRNPNNIGVINMEVMTIGDTITAQIAYILSPEMYEKYDALYFTGGNGWTSDLDQQLMTKIALK